MILSTVAIQTVDQQYYFKFHVPHQMFPTSHPSTIYPFIPPSIHISILSFLSLSHFICPSFNPSLSQLLHLILSKFIHSSLFRYHPTTFLTSIHPFFPTFLSSIHPFHHLSIPPFLYPSIHPSNPFSISSSTTLSSILPLIPPSLLSFHPSILLFHPSFLSLHAFIHQSFYSILLFYPSIFQPVYPSMHSSINPSVPPFLPFYPSIFQPIYPSIHPPILLTTQVKNTLLISSHLIQVCDALLITSVYVFIVWKPLGLKK